MLMRKSSQYILHIEYFEISDYLHVCVYVCVCVCVCVCVRERKRERERES